MVETETERAAFLADFGVPVEVGAYTFTGIYDAPHVEPFDAAGQARRVLMRSSDVRTGGIVDGTPVTVGDVAYIARTPEPDGTGFTTVPLQDPDPA